MSLTGSAGLHSYLSFATVGHGLPGSIKSCSTHASLQGFSGGVEPRSKVGRGRAVRAGKPRWCVEGTRCTGSWGRCDGTAAGHSAVCLARGGCEGGGVGRCVGLGGGVAAGEAGGAVAALARGRAGGGAGGRARWGTAGAARGRRGGAGGAGGGRAAGGGACGGRVRVAVDGGGAGEGRGSSAATVLLPPMPPTAGRAGTRRSMYVAACAEPSAMIAAAAAHLSAACAPLPKTSRGPRLISISTPACPTRTVRAIARSGSGAAARIWSAAPARASGRRGR